MSTNGSVSRTIVRGRGGYVVASDKTRDSGFVRSEGSMICSRIKFEFQNNDRRVVGKAYLF